MEKEKKYNSEKRIAKKRIGRRKDRTDVEWNAIVWSVIICEQLRSQKLGMLEERDLELQMFFFPLNPPIHQEKEILTNPKFDQKLSKTWSIIISSKDRNRIISGRLNLTRHD